MLKNHLKIAWRSIIHNKLNTSINIVGLSLGLCACIVIYTICTYEFSFDTFHKEGDRIYRVMGNVTESTGIKSNFGRVPIAVSQNGRTELSGVDIVAGLIPYNAGVTIPNSAGPAAKHFDSRVGDSRFITTAFTEPGYFDIFKYRWVAGDPVTALPEPFKVVLTESKARQYFGSRSLDDIIGRQVIYGDSITVTT